MKPFCLDPVKFETKSLISKGILILIKHNCFPEKALKINHGVFYLNIIQSARATHYLYYYFFFVSKSVSWVKLILYGLPLFQYVSVMDIRQRNGPMCQPAYAVKTKMFAYGHIILTYKTI